MAAGDEGREEASGVPSDWMENDFAFPDERVVLGEYCAVRSRKHRCPGRGWRVASSASNEGRLLEEAA